MVQLDFLSPLRRTPLLCQALKLSTKTSFVNVFLCSKSYCSCGFLHQVPCCTLQRYKDEFSWFTHSLGHKLRQICLGPHTTVSCKHICVVLHLIFCRVGFFLLSNTNLFCSFSRGVLTVLAFALHPDFLMMNGKARFPRIVQLDLSQL